MEEYASRRLILVWARAMMLPTVMVRAEEIHQSMKASAEQFRSSVLALLTPEQTEQIAVLEEMMTEMENSIQERAEQLEAHLKAEKSGSGFFLKRC